ncbi:exporter of polyketide antibiotics [Pseudonocardia aurantiaca]|uniref:ABC transporter permease n=1 Tax=Pseudonocardia aurantiaca TaxID=75290 RepID=A0ABW4FXE5_9PSEU
MSTLTGTGQLIRLALRRDRVLLPLWVLVPSIFPAVFVVAFTTAFPTPQALQEYAETSIHNAAFTVFYGALQGPSLGELVTWRAGFVPVMIGLFSLLAVIRHTRTEEEAGRRELVVSTAVSRHAAMAAAVLVTCGANLVIGLLSALMLAGQGLPAAGSLAHGTGIAAVGCVFAAVGAVVAQLTTGAGSARGIGITVLGVAFLLRGIGDVSTQSGGALGWISWLSPIGWVSRLRPFAGERWWILVVPCVAATGLIAMAVALAERRDVGSGLLPSRLGPAGAAPALRTPAALAWRLHRGSLVSRTVGFAVVGFGLGGIATSIGELMNNSTPAAREVLARLGGPGTVIDQYLWAMMTVFGVVSAGFAIQIVLTLRAEESGGRAEPVLAAPVERLRWASGHLAIALLGPILWAVVFGTVVGLAHGLSTGDVGRGVSDALGAALVELPAVWAFAALALALFGLLPRLAAWTFALLMTSLLLGWLGEELHMGQWLINLSVFAHLPHLPGGELTVLPLLVMTAIAAALVLVGVRGLRRRDMPVG